MSHRFRDASDWKFALMEIDRHAFGQGISDPRAVDSQDGKSGRLIDNGARVADCIAQRRHELLVFVIENGGASLASDNSVMASSGRFLHRDDNSELIATTSTSHLTITLQLGSFWQMMHVSKAALGQIVFLHWPAQCHQPNGLSSRRRQLSPANRQSPVCRSASPTWR
jgi:hypothetical protein